MCVVASGQEAPAKVFHLGRFALEAWIELVHSAREAGISVRTKTVQLLHVGFGLPLDALKKGTITEWSCTYHLADGEVSPLLDALIKNSSLSRLHLAAAGLDWSGPEASKERSGGACRAMPTLLCRWLMQMTRCREGCCGPLGRLAPHDAS